VLPSLLLNSHHDTVKPNSGYTRNPFEAAIEDDKLFGLGSNDAGGALVALAAVFLNYYEQENLPLNIIYAATAEEEISGKGGIESVINDLGIIELAIVGEPTTMQMAVAERGLLVLDCTAKGKAGHAARNEGVNAIYEAMKDIEWFRNYRFEKISEWLGAVSMNVTMINAGTAHNQVPAECMFTVDIRLNDCYTHEQVLQTIRQHVSCEVKERSTRIRPSHIDAQHPMVQVARAKNISLYGSPTTSDMALMPFASVKIGPGDSARSHSADEFVYLHEIENGIAVYHSLISDYFHHLLNSK
jgi:acetylornithine deacetylase